MLRHARHEKERRQGATDMGTRLCTHAVQTPWPSARRTVQDDSSETQGIADAAGRRVGTVDAEPRKLIKLMKRGTNIHARPYPNFRRAGTRGLQVPALHVRWQYSPLL